MLITPEQLRVVCHECPFLGWAMSRTRERRVLPRGCISILNAEYAQPDDNIFIDCFEYVCPRYLVSRDSPDGVNEFYKPYQDAWDSGRARAMAIEQKLDRLRVRGKLTKERAEKIIKETPW